MSLPVTAISSFPMLSLSPCGTGDSPLLKLSALESNCLLSIAIATPVITDPALFFPNPFLRDVVNRRDTSIHFWDYRWLRFVARFGNAP